VKLRMLAGLAQIPLRVDMVYWPTPGCPPVSPRGAAAEIECAVSIPRCCRRGHVNRNAVQGAAREQVRSLVRPAGTFPSRRRPETSWREKERGRTPADDPLTAAGTRLV
jgi:hypothetical protein